MVGYIDDEVETVKVARSEVPSLRASAGAGNKGASRSSSLDAKARTTQSLSDSLNEIAKILGLTAGAASRVGIPGKVAAGALAVLAGSAKLGSMAIEKKAAELSRRAEVQRKAEAVRKAEEARKVEAARQMELARKVAVAKAKAQAAAAKARTRKIRQRAERDWMDRDHSRLYDHVDHGGSRMERIGSIC